MGKKRRQEQRGDHSSSSDGKRYHMSCQNGETSRPSLDEMQPTKFLEIFASMLQELKEIKGSIQVKGSTEEKLTKKFVKLEKKVTKIKNKSKEDLCVFMEDLQKELKGRVKEELKIEIQEEMQKEGCARLDEKQKQFKEFDDDHAKVQRFNASPYLRSQPHQSLTTRFQLEIKSRVSNPVYKGKTIRTDDSGDYIEVVMYDGGNLIASDHPLSSVRVQLVVVDGRFNECNQEFWSKEDFEESIIKTREGNPRVGNVNQKSIVKNCIFKLIGGSHCHKGAVIMENSNRKDVKLGVIIAEYTRERILEGLSNPFRVQEAKTKNRGKHKGSATDDTAKESSSQLSCIQIKENDSGQIPVSNNGQELNIPQVPMPRSSPTPMQMMEIVKGLNFPQSTVQNSSLPTVGQIQELPEGLDGYDEGLVGYDNPISFPPATMQNSSQLNATQIVGDGQAQAGNGQQSFQHAQMQTSPQLWEPENNSQTLPVYILISPRSN